MKETKPGRSIRIADQIARDLAEIIPRELRDPPHRSCDDYRM